jgi:hypothetical protein
MQFEFDEKIEKAITKSVKSAMRLFKERQQQALANHIQHEPPSYEDFTRIVEQIMETNKNADLKKLRTPSLRELYDRAWAQKLRNFATQQELRDAYEALMRAIQRSSKAS